MIGGRFAAAVLIGVLLFAHHKTHRDLAERAHTRLLIMGFVVWIILAFTDLVHHRIGSVPQMSAIGMLLSVAVMTIVMDRVRPNGPSRWWAFYTVALFVVALCGNVVVFKTLPAPTAMMLARTLILVVVGLAAAREVFVMVIRRRQRIAELALLGRVTAQMAHDLQNPLAAIKCATQVIEEDRSRGLGGADAPRQQRMLATIAQQTERLSAIVDDYRRVGRIEPRMEPVALAEVVRRTGRPENLTIDIDLAGVPRCQADPQLVARAIDNLVRNAAEAMPDGGRVAVSARTVGEGSARWVELTVADDGPGMDARTCERAFDDFFTTKAKGSGLGLAFVRRVAEVHGGVARVASRVGRGTSVTLRLPAVPHHPIRFSQRAHAAA
jgi:signal transduction histidine kinase